MSNEILMGVMILVIVAVSATGFVMISNEGNITLNKAIADPVNNQGIQVNNTTGYQTVQIMTSTVADNLVVAVFLAILLIIVLLMMAYRVIT